ncbi:MAG: HigA family addiction module antitoxin [bacterium]
MPVKNQKPMHPGQVLAEVYMKEMDLNQSTLAAKIGCAHRKINEIVNGKRGISADFAIDLERTLGTSAEMWINMQASYDLWVARQKRRKAA